jgi:hypothetical protein
VILCDVCPHEADLEWSTPSFRALTPEGVVVVESVVVAASVVIRMCASCFRGFVAKGTAIATPERLRRMQRPS